MRYGMLDNFRGGAAVDGGLECTKDEAAIISRAMLRSGGQETWAGKEFQLNIDGRVMDNVRTRLDVFLQEDKRSRGKWYFNVAANPNSVFKGHNKYGLLENTVQQVQKLFTLALRYLQDKGRTSMRTLLDRVKEGEVFVHSIAFAVYTKPLRGNATKLEALIGAWYFLFESRVRFGNEYVSLLQALGLARGDKEQYKTSFPLRVFSPPRPGRDAKPRSGHQLMHLSAYMKNQELYEKKAPFTALEARDLGSRARLDLTVSRYFFCSYWGIKRVTLKELERVVKTRFGSWSKAVESLMQHALERTCLSYVMNPPNPFDARWSARRAQWEGEWGRGAFSETTKTWAKQIGLNLKISPRAHIIMHSGLRGLADSTEQNIRMWLDSDAKADEYTRKLAGVMKEMREKSGMLKAASNLMALDFSTVYTGVARHGA